MSARAASSVTAGKARHAILLAIAAAILAALFIALRFPGELNPDSSWQYDQAVRGQYDDWHPPAMARLWSVFRLLADGPWTMFVFHAACYWLAFLVCGLALIAAGHRVLAWACLAVALFPPFLMLAVNIHKDVGLAVTLLLGFSLTLLARTLDRESLVTRLASSVPLAYALLVRTNGSFAVLPIIAYVWCPRIVVRPLAVTAITLGLTLPLQPLQAVINHDLLGAKPANALRTLLIFDLAGIAHFTGDARVAGEPNPESPRFRTCYSPAIADALYDGARCGFVWTDLIHGEGVASAEREESLPHRWLTAIAKHPLAYAWHRAAHFNDELAFVTPAHSNDTAVVRRIVNGGSPPDPPRRNRVLDAARNTVFAAPAFWLAAAIAILLAVYPLDRPASLSLDRAAAALALSAVIYTLGYAVVGVATDPRYELPAMLGASVASVLAWPTLRERMRHPRPRDRAAFLLLLLVTIVVVAARTILPDALRA